MMATNNLSQSRAAQRLAKYRLAVATLARREATILRDDENDTSAGNRMRKAFAAACRRAGIKNFTPHCCRHTWATWHYAKNHDLLALQRLGGWKSLAMVTRYAHVNVGELAQTIDNLPWPEAGGKLGDTASTGAKSA